MGFMRLWRTSRGIPGSRERLMREFINVYTIGAQAIWSSRLCLFTAGANRYNKGSLMRKCELADA